MALSLQAFHRQLAAGELKPACLVAGAEHLLVIEAADAFRARAREAGYLEREVFDVDPHFDWNRLADAGRALSLFASRKLIDLRLPSGRPGKEGSAAIIAYCEAPPPDTLLLVTANDWSRKHEGAWSSAIGRVGDVLALWPLKREELPGWIAARASARKLALAPDAVALLAERVEGNLLAAAQEIDKLALLHGAGPALDAAGLDASVADDARFDVFRLVDAALAGDAARALHVLAGLRAEGEELIPLTGWVLTQLRLLLRVASSANATQALRAERIWPPGREALLRRALQQGDRDHWERCLVQAGRVDAIAKGRPPGDAWRELERLVAAIAAPRRAARLLAS